MRRREFIAGCVAVDLAVVQLTKFDFVIDLETTRALRFSISETRLATADEVIQ
jgi:hypothetical protein